jgi:hypothetical protein
MRTRSIIALSAGVALFVAFVALCNALPKSEEQQIQDNYNQCYRSYDWLTREMDACLKTAQEKAITYYRKVGKYPETWPEMRAAAQGGLCSRRYGPEFCPPPPKP